jgi:hypothetical protein
VSKVEIRLDPILLITAAIFAVLFMMAYLLFSIFSMMAIVVGMGLVIYQILSLKGRLASKFRYGRHFPSTFLFFLIGYQWFSG